MNIPQQYRPVMPYLIVNNARAFADFANKVFNAEEQLIVPREEKIRHGELKINEAVIMFADATESWKTKTAGMYMYVEDVNNVYNRAMEQGSKGLMPPQQQSYGYTAGFEDPFENHWYIVEPVKE